MTYTQITKSEEETRDLAYQLAEQWQQLLTENCLVVLLNGELGAGKTHFVKSVAKAMHITQNVVSPTYTYIRAYPMTKGQFVHVDAWRIEKQIDFESTGIQEYIKPGNILLVEWPKDFFVSSLANNPSTKLINIAIREVGETAREFTISE